MTVILPGGLGQTFAKTAVSFSTWSPTANSGNITYSNANRSVIGTSATNWGNVKGSVVRTSGKLYFEVTFAAVAGNQFQSAGIVDSSWAPGTGSFYIGFDANGDSIGAVAGTSNYTNQQKSVTGYSLSTAPAAGNVIGVAVDFSYVSGPAFYASLNGIFIGTGTTTKPTNPDWWLPTGSSAAAACSVNNSGTATLNVGNASFAHSPPSGFSAWG